MSSLMEEISHQLKRRKANARILRLWKDIFKQYEEGGEKAVKDSISAKIKDVGKKFRREVDEAKVVARLKKPKKRR